jgi:hypothetical protein
MVELLVTAATDRFRQRPATMLHLLAYAGPRISECLALRNDDRIRFGEDGCWHIEIRELVHKSARRTLPPKWRKCRWTFVPHWLTDDVGRLLSDTAPGELLLPHPAERCATPPASSSASTPASTPTATGTTGCGSRSSPTRPAGPNALTGGRTSADLPRPACSPSAAGFGPCAHSGTCARPTS